MHKLLLKDLNVSEAQTELLNNPEVWKRIQIRQNIPNSAHSDTESVYIRGPADFSPEGLKNSLECMNSQFAKDNLPGCIQIVRQVVKLLKPSEIGRIIVANLKAGGSIKKHVDNGPYASQFDRYHIPIKTNDQVISYSPNDAVNMKEGELWLYPHQTEHWVENNGDTDRWHLVFDLRAPIT
jgi:hypothetical protein